MEWLANIDWVQVGRISLEVFAVAQIIARATPTKKDDQIVSRIGKILNFIFSATRTKK